MKYFIIVGIVIVVAVAALFLIKDSDALLLLAIATIIAGFWFAVLQIPKEDGGEY